MVSATKVVLKRDSPPQEAIPQLLGGVWMTDGDILQTFEDAKKALGRPVKIAFACVAGERCSPLMGLAFDQAMRRKGFNGFIHTDSFGLHNKQLAEKPVEEIARYARDYDLLVTFNFLVPMLDKVAKTLPEDQRPGIFAYSVQAASLTILDDIGKAYLDPLIQQIARHLRKKVVQPTR